MKQKWNLNVSALTLAHTTLNISAFFNSKIVSYPIKFAAGNWEDVTGTLQENIAMILLAHWENGKIAEEYLFWQMPAQYIE